MVDLWIVGKLVDASKHVTLEVKCPDLGLDIFKRDYCIQHPFIQRAIQSSCSIGANEVFDVLVPRCKKGKLFICKLLLHPGQSHYLRNSVKLPRLGVQIIHDRTIKLRNGSSSIAVVVVLATPVEAYSSHQH